MSGAETNGGSAAAGGPSTAPHAGESMLAQIAALRALCVNELRAKYLQAFGEPTTSRNKDWLFRQVAWQMQANAEGGLSERAKRRAADLARESDVRPRRRHLVTPGTPPSAPPPRIVPVGPVRDAGAPLPGSVLVRDYKGQQIRVVVLDHGFEWNGRHFGSLSAVAKGVTGAHWNGHLFFGLRKPKAPGAKAS